MKLNVLVVGCGNMGSSHARAYHKMKEFKIIGLVSRNSTSREKLSKELGGTIPTYNDFHEALKATSPDVVSINTYPDTHASYALASLEHGTHVFVEKPLAMTVAEAQAVVEKAKIMKKKLVVGYILRVHPAWQKFVNIARTLGKPLVMRMNLNQQSFGKDWESHKHLMNRMSPIVDCGVHYIDIMCMMTKAKPVRVSSIGARLSEELADDMYNYGNLQVTFDDGSVGWYEAGWGPMMSETASFIKDVIGPKGSVSIVEKLIIDTADVSGHTKTGCLQIHHSALNKDKTKFIKNDEFIDTSNEPSHDELCELEQRFLLSAIKNNIDLSKHGQDAVNSLKVVLAADEAFKTGKTIHLS